MGEDVDRLMDMLILPAMTHPFDDPVFAAMAADAGHVRADLPTDYDPTREWQPGAGLGRLPLTTFIVGDDDGYPGEIRIDLIPDGSLRYERRAGSCFVTVPGRLPETVIAQVEGRPLSRVLEVPGIGHWLVHWVMAEGPDTCMLLQPPDSIGVRAYPALALAA